MARLDETIQRFDYDALLTISTGWEGCLYCLSPETAYLAGLSIERFTGWRNRWEKSDGSSLSDEEWDNAQAIVAQGVYELMASCDQLGSDIRSGLETLAAAIKTGSGGCGPGYTGNPVADCIAGLDNDDLLGPGGSEQGNPATDPPPDGFATWEEYFVYKCDASYFIWWLVRKYLSVSRDLDGFAAIAISFVPLFSGLAGLLPAVFTPAGFVAFIAAIVGIALASGLAWFFMAQAIDYWDTNQEAIICSLYESGTSVEAVTAIGNAIEDAIQAITAWGALEAVAGQLAGLLADAFGTLAGNGLVAPLFEASASVVAGSYDCASCAPPQEGDLFQTSLILPFNELIVGEAITFSLDNETVGFGAQNNGTYVDLVFEVTGACALWEWSAEYFNPYEGTTQTATAQLQQNDGGGWFNVGDLWQFPDLAWVDNPHLIGATDIDDRDMSPAEGRQYRMHLAPMDFNLYGYYRKITGACLE